MYLHPATKEVVKQDIVLAQQVFGEANVFWPYDLSWIKIDNYRLPNIYNRPTTKLLIIPPPNYGLVNVPLEEFYMDQGLLVWNGNQWSNIPHYHRRGDLNKYSKKSWVWFCCHPKSWEHTDSILQFLKLIDLLLKDPFRWVN